MPERGVAEGVCLLPCPPLGSTKIAAVVPCFFRGHQGGDAILAFGCPFSCSYLFVEGVPRPAFAITWSGLFPSVSPVRCVVVFPTLVEGFQGLAALCGVLLVE